MRGGEPLHARALRSFFWSHMNLIARPLDKLCSMPKDKIETSVTTETLPLSPAECSVHWRDPWATRLGGIRACCTVHLGTQLAYDPCTTDKRLWIPATPHAHLLLLIPSR